MMNCVLILMASLLSWMIFTASGFTALRPSSIDVIQEIGHVLFPW